MKDEIRDERLRRMLREADPSEDDAGLTMEEVRDMRRSVLRAIPETRRRWVFSPVLAGVVMAALFAIAVLMLWPRSESTPPTPPAPPRIAVKRTDTDVKRTDMKHTDVKRTEVRPSGDVSAGAVAAGLRARRPTTAAPGGSPGEQIAVANEPETLSRQIQFDTPGGTRVIWILTSNNAL
jgi:hypothetical protein